MSDIKKYFPIKSPKTAEKPEKITGQTAGNKLKSNGNRGKEW